MLGRLGPATAWRYSDSMPSGRRSTARPPPIRPGRISRSASPFISRAAESLSGKRSSPFGSAASAAGAKLTWTHELKEQGSAGGFSHPETIDKRAEQAESQSARHALKFLHRRPWATGGRPTGAIKGAPMTRRQIIAWAREWLDTEGGWPSMQELADRMGVRSETTARNRRRPVGIPNWPPT